MLAKCDLGTQSPLPSFASPFLFLAAAYMCVAVLPELRDSFGVLLSLQISCINLLKNAGLKREIVLGQERVWGMRQKKKSKADGPQAMRL